ncbi:MAG: Bug family tripartite tricarboxylate transporter substrate binding protein, partial [Burkholderiales bacterium]
ALAQARAGKLRAIALTSPVKLASAPDWPALADTLPGFDASPRTFVLAPAGTPAAVIARLDAALRAMLAKPAVQETLNAQGAIPTPAGAEELAAQIAAESRKWGAVARESGARAQ